ncbi:MAG: amino acid ABC transporter permease [Anaerolineales bacterium]|nr:MAG: amino acid ABC transporter permease [Anaerolineales bacterium]
MTAQTTVKPPLAERHTPLGWLRKNLFNSWGNAILTIVAGWLTFVTLRGLITWVFTEADWTVIETNLRLILLGQYPIAEVWRIWVSMLLLAFLIGNSLSIWGKGKTSTRFTVLLTGVLLALAFVVSGPSRQWLLGMAALLAAGWWLARGAGKAMRNVVGIGWVVWPPIFILLLRGFGEGGLLPQVGTNLWGGLMLTFMLTIVGIVFSFPIGVLLALGRQSELRIVRWFCIAFIEIVRGVPLITILFMAQLMLPLFLPAGLTIDRVLRAMVGITLFSAAYLAENVRGGLQAIPKGQYEAAYALGLSNPQSMGLIILPQALRLIIPILVGQFIALFKDTALVAIVGLFDLVGIARTVLAQPAFLGTHREVYAFISLLYWVFSYAMSYVSIRLEDSLGVGKR